MTLGNWTEKYFAEAALASFGLPEEFAQLVQTVVSKVMLNGSVIRLDGATRMAAR